MMASQWEALLLAATGSSVLSATPSSRHNPKHGSNQSLGAELNETLSHRWRSHQVREEGHRLSPLHPEELGDVHDVLLHQAQLPLQHLAVPVDAALRMQSWGVVCVTGTPGCWGTCQCVLRGCKRSCQVFMSHLSTYTCAPSSKYTRPVSHRSQNYPTSWAQMSVPSLTLFPSRDPSLPRGSPAVSWFNTSSRHRQLPNLYLPGHFIQPTLFPKLRRAQIANTPHLS